VPHSPEHQPRRARLPAARILQRPAKQTSYQNVANRSLCPDCGRRRFGGFGSAGGPRDAVKIYVQVFMAFNPKKASVEYATYFEKIFGSDLKR